MTTNAATALAATMLALGLLVGAAGTIVIRDATTDDASSLMGAHMTGDGMMSMMTGSMMGPGASMPPADHGAHHPSPGAQLP